MTYDVLCGLYCVCVSVSEGSAEGPGAIPEACGFTDRLAGLQLDEDTSDISLGNVSIEWYCEHSVDFSCNDEIHASFVCLKLVNNFIS